MEKFFRYYLFVATLFIFSCFLSNLFLSKYNFFPTLNLVGFLLLLLLTIYNKYTALKGLVFILPFTANISQQVKAVFNVELFILDPLSVDATIGFLLGLLIVEFTTKKFNTSSRTNILIGLLISYHTLIIITVVNAISRNFYQSASSYSIDGLIYNFINLRYLGVYNDYYPLMDLFVFTTAIVLSIRLLSLSCSQKQFFNNILIPLVAATAIVLGYALYSKITSIGYYKIDGVDGISSFFPEIHAYGGYAIATYIGALYYLNHSQLKIKIVSGVFLLFAAFGTLVSSSRFSIALLFIISLIYLIIFVIKNPQKYRFLLGITFLISIGLSTIHYWDNRGLIKSLSDLTKVSSFAEINTVLSERPEIFTANLLMFSHYPFLGIGKGIFYRQSSIYEFSKSNFFAIENSGENAHNYFFQVLVETGTIGLIIFCSLFIYQYFCLKNKNNTIISILILGIFSGNLYGHSLLIPNIFLILFVLLGVTNTSCLEEPLAISLSKPLRYLLIITTVIVVLISTSEVKNSYGKLPFQQSFVCYKPKVEYSDRSTSGLFISKHKVTGNTLKLNYVVYHPDVAKHPLKVMFDVRQGDRAIVQLVRQVSSPGQYQDKLDISQLPPGTNFLLQIKTSRCFTPINLGFNLDSRRLGIQLTQVSQLRSDR